MGKIIPSAFAGISIHGSVSKLIGEVSTKDRKKWVNKEKDLLKFIVELLSSPVVQKRVFDEFEAESTLQLLVSENPSATILVSGFEDESEEKKGAIPILDVFHAKQLTYGSWTLVQTILNFVDAHPVYKTKFYEGVDRNRFGAPRVLKLVFAAYGRVAVSKNMKGDKKRDVMRTMLQIGKLYQQAIYGWNNAKGKFMVSLTSPTFLMHVNLDQNILDKFNVADNVLFKGFQNKVKVVVELKHELKYFQVPVIKAAVVAKTGTKATMNILSPQIIHETDLRQVVTSMASVVFGTTNKWDRVEIAPNDDKQLNTALCLLMLGIGSRARGIIMVNQIEEIDAKSKAGEEKVELLGVDESIVNVRRELMAHTPGHGTLRVRRITKEREKERQKVDEMMKDEVWGDGKMTDAEAVSLVDLRSDARLIDKPFQFYFFDPVLANKDDSKKVAGDFYTSKDPSKQNPREVYMQLFMVVREALRARCVRDSFRVRWEQYTTGDRKIWMLGGGDQANPRDVARFHAKAYMGMKTECEFWMKQISGMKVLTPHQLRRLYVCYSYEYFGRGITKEIGYAQYVLRHKTITTSQTYTTLIIEMVLNDRLRPVKMEANRLAVEAARVMDKMKQVHVMMDDMRRELKVVRESVGASGEGASVGGKRRKESVEFVLEDGEVVEFQKLGRVPNGSSRSYLVERAVAHVGIMKAAGVKLSRVNLIRAGINTKIVAEVMGLVL